MGGRSSLLDCVPVLDPRVDWRRAHVNVGVSSGNSRAKRETKRASPHAVDSASIAAAARRAGLKTAGEGSAAAASLLFLLPEKDHFVDFGSVGHRRPSSPPVRDLAERSPMNGPHTKGRTRLGPAATVQEVMSMVIGHCSISRALCSARNVAGPECVIAVPHRFLRIFPSTV